MNNMKFEQVENPMVNDSVWRRYESESYLEEADRMFEGDDLDVVCAVCGERVWKEDAIESERWDDYFLCEDKECHDKHYQGWSKNVSAGKWYK